MGKLEDVRNLGNFSPLERRTLEFALHSLAYRTWWPLKPDTLQFEAKKLLDEKSGWSAKVLELVGQEHWVDGPPISQPVATGDIEVPEAISPEEIVAAEEVADGK